MKKMMMALVHCDAQYEFFNKLNPVHVLDYRGVITVEAITYYINKLSHLLSTSHSNIQ